LFRGTSQSEIEETIAGATWQQAANNRLECSKDLLFNSTWNGRPYARKKIRPIFVDEPLEIVVITVYVYYF